MSSRLLNLSLCLNLLLLGVAGYRLGKSHSGSNGSFEVISPMPALAPDSQTNTVMQLPLKWSEIESEDYAIYIANLRRAGCPEPVLRRIIRAELKELYAKKAFALVRDFHRDFWEIAARENVREHFETTFGQRIKAICTECDTLLKLFVGETSDEVSNSPKTGAVETGLLNFLSPARQEQLRVLTERYEARLHAIERADLAPEEKMSKLSELRREMESEQRKVLSAEEWAEYQLRQSSAASEVQQLIGVDFSEAELRNIAKTIDLYQRENGNQSETLPNPETLDQKLEALLGPTRFNDLNRARSASYRELYEFASNFGLPDTTATEIFDLRLESEKRSEVIRSETNRASTEKQTLLDELQEQVEQAVLTKLGGEAGRIYKAKHGRWIDSLGRL